MKKILSLILAVLMLMAAMTSCSDKNEDGTTPDSQQSETEETAGNAGTSSNGGELTTRDPFEVLESIWARYEDDEKFPTAGGDFSEENSVIDAPGVFSTSDAEYLDSMLGLPAADVEKIKSAASLMHMMNANTFTGAAYAVKNSDDIATIVDDIKENILSRQWMCGFPDTLVIYSIDDCIVSAFGNAEIIKTFQSKVTSAYDNAVLEAEESLI